MLINMLSTPFVELIGIEADICEKRQIVILPKATGNTITQECSFLGELSSSGMDLKPSSN